MTKAESARSLEEVRWRIDAIDAELLALLDERAGLAGDVAAAKAAAGGPPAELDEAGAARERAGPGIPPGQEGPPTRPRRARRAAA